MSAQVHTMPPVVGETVKPGGSNRRNIGRDLCRWTAVACGATAISPENPTFCLFVAGAVAARLKVWFTMAKVPLPEMEKMYEAVFRSLRKTGRGRSAIRFRFA
ncbi:hypothetical protein [Bradyrhizobium sp. dw_411]|uniref:hypothetical protein n=1 Tax=Bradyrhizobium sp. dw_411 TaxID=2720082 RepID=UPI001BCC2BE2|nr:hypothetical protein [Bradyrhizobium sp. dw_411]